MQLALVWSEPLVGVSAAALPSGRAGAGARGRWRAREAARTALVSSLGTSASAMAKRKRFFAAALGADPREKSMGQFLTHFTKYYPCRVCSDPMLPTPPAAQPPPTPQGPNVDVVPRGSIRDPLRRGTLRPSPHHPPRRPGRHPSPSSPPPSHTCLSAQQPRCTARSLPHALTRRAPASAAPAPPTPAPAPAPAPAAAASARGAGLLPALRPFPLRPRL